MYSVALGDFDQHIHISSHCAWNTRWQWCNDDTTLRI